MLIFYEFIIVCVLYTYFIRLMPICPRCYQVYFSEISFLYDLTIFTPSSQAYHPLHLCFLMVALHNVNPSNALAMVGFGNIIG